MVRLLAYFIRTRIKSEKKVSLLLVHIRLSYFFTLSIKCKMNLECRVVLFQTENIVAIMCYSVNDVASFNRLKSVVSKLHAAEQCTGKYNTRTSQ